MSKRKDIERASQFVYRSGVKVPRHVWDRQRRKKQEASDAQRLSNIGLVLGRSRILTPEEVMKERRTIK